MPRGKRKWFQPLNEALPGVLARLGLKDKIKPYQVVVDWRTIAGEAIAQHASAVAVDGKVLVVVVDSPAWMTQLLFLKEKLLEKIAERIGAGIIEDVRFVLKREPFST